jgi:hypothetical protein
VKATWLKINHLMDEFHADDFTSLKGGFTNTGPCLSRDQGRQRRWEVVPI